MSWSSDECCSVYAVKDSTIQWCIITEPINIGIHYEEGQLQAHGYGGIWGGKNMSYHHNLVASSISRYPLVGTSATVHSYNYEPDYMSLLDIRNNVFYNWQSNSSHGGQNMVRVNLVNNYYKMGPASKDLKRFYKMMGTQPENQSSYPIVGAATDLAIDGNYYDAIKPSEKVALINSDNVFGVEFDNYTETYNLEKYDETAEPSEKSHTQYIKDYPITTESAIEAFGSVVQSAGHNFPRDSVDERAVNDTVKRISTVGENGILNYDKFILLEKPEYYGTGKLDSDGDGIPDDWEDSHELNKNNPADSLKIANENQYDGKYTGYLNIEAYSFDILENPPEPTEDPTSSPLPTSAPARGIYYAKSPEISGANITASIVNENDESGAVFAACSYDESGKIMTDVKIVRIPKSDIPQDINVTLKSDKNIKTASAVVTNILTVPHAAVEEAISEEADDVNALHEAYHQVMGEYVAKDDDGVFIWWQTLTGYSSSWNFSIEVDDLTVQLKETTDAFSVYNFQAAATITTADQAEHVVEFSGVVQLTSDGKADYMNLYGSGMDMIDSIVSQPL